MSVPTLPKLPMGDPLDGSETVVMRQGGVPKRFWASVLRGLKGADSTVPGPPGTPKRIQTFTSGKSTAAGLAKVVFDPPFAAVPFVQAGIAWSGSQIVHAIPSNVTKAGCDVTLVRSRGNLVGTQSPFETVANLTGTVTAFGE